MKKNVRFLWVLGFAFAGVVDSLGMSLPSDYPDVYEDEAKEESVNTEVSGLCAEMASDCDWKTNLGVKASLILDFVGPVFSSKEIQGQELGYGGALGGAVRFNHRSKWFVETGLSVAYARSGLELGRLSADGAGFEWKHASLKRGRISIPVFAGYGFTLFDQLAMNVNTGFEGSYTFAGSVGDGNEMNYSMFGRDGIWRRWNLMYTLGVGIEVNVFSVEISGGFGLLNMARQKVFHSSTMNESAVTISAVYWFGK